MLNMIGPQGAMSLPGSAGPRARKARGTPVLIAGAGQTTQLAKVGLGETSYNEAWLQQLAFEHPQLLPIGDIEPAFGELVPVAREVPCGHGYLDNLYVTPGGELVLVEAKLWRNPQARREVVAQALDYVAALTGMTYDAFERACLQGQGMAAASLHALVAGRGDALDESAFVDAVTANLRCGRMVVIALGDGIRSEAEALSALLQSHAGAHFTFALVELACWRNPASGEILALPSTLAQTVMITRGVVTFDDPRTMIVPAPAAAQSQPSSISEELYYEELAKKQADWPQLVRSFVVSLEPLGVYPELKASLNLKADLPGYPRATNFGYITKSGKVWTDTLAWTADAQIAATYNQTLAELIGGSVAHTTSGSSYLSTNGTSAPRLSDLLPQHGAAWAGAIAAALQALRKHAAVTGDQL